MPSKPDGESMKNSHPIIGSTHHFFHSLMIELDFSTDCRFRSCQSIIDCSKESISCSTNQCETMIHTIIWSFVVSDQTVIYCNCEKAFKIVSCTDISISSTGFMEVKSTRRPCWPPVLLPFNYSKWNLHKLQSHIVHTWNDGWLIGLIPEVLDKFLCVLVWHQPTRMKWNDNRLSECCGISCSWILTSIASPITLNFSATVHILKGWLVRTSSFLGPPEATDGCLSRLILAKSLVFPNVSRHVIQEPTG